MKLLILGATGLTGRHVVDVALRSGDSVTAFVRNPAALGDLADRVTLATGDATLLHDLATALPGHDAVVSALGAGNSLTSVRADDLFTRSSEAVIGAAKETGVSRLVWLSSFGVGHTLDWSSTPQKLIYRTLLRDIYANKAIADEHIRSSGLDWTIVLPTRLTTDPAKGTYNMGDKLPIRATRPSAGRTSPPSCTRRYTAASGSTAAP
jgi:putative NADH-flavin reductase